MRALLLIWLVAISLPAMAQDKQQLSPCGSPTFKSPWLKKYQANPQKFETRGVESMYVPLTIAIVGKDDGTDYINESRLFKAIKKLNADYEQVDLKFFLRTDPRYINDSRYASHSTVLEGADLMFEHNVDDAINCYFVADAAGNCGYNLPYAGIAVSNNCAFPTDHTWAHEMGHNLSLPHPFLGWEGNVDCQNLRSWNEPSPTTLVYDYTYFQDTLIRDTVILDTTYVELVDRSNCHIAADGFCDTEPDYLACRWTCGPTGASPVQQIDPNGETFRSDGSLIMAYSDDDCQGIFTGEQIAAMRANLLDEKPHLLVDTDPPAEITAAPPTLLTPVEGQNAYFAEVEMTWTPVENAMYYLVAASHSSSIASTVFDTITTKPYAIGRFRRAGRKVYWQVTPFTSHHFDYEPSEKHTFELVETVNTNEVSVAQPYKIYTNIIRAGSIKLSLEKPLRISIFNSAGIEMYQTKGEGKDLLDIDASNWESGVYFIRMTDGKAQWLEKIVVI